MFHTIFKLCVVLLLFAFSVHSLHIYKGNRNKLRHYHKKYYLLQQPSSKFNPDVFSDPVKENSLQKCYSNINCPTCHRCFYDFNYGCKVCKNQCKWNIETTTKREWFTIDYASEITVGSAQTTELTETTEVTTESTTESTTEVTTESTTESTTEVTTESTTVTTESIIPSTDATIEPVESTTETTTLATESTTDSITTSNIKVKESTTTFQEKEGSGNDDDDDEKEAEVEAEAEAELDTDKEIVDSTPSSSFFKLF